MINHNAVKSIETSKMFFMCRDTIANIAAQAIADTAFGNVEMILDAQPDGISKEEVDILMNDLRDQAAEFMLDTINELRLAIISQIYNTNFTTAVRALKYTTDGDLNDIDLDIEFED